MRKINSITIITSNYPKSKKIKEKLVEVLTNYNFKIDDENYDLAIAIGGDGTFIKMVRDLDFKNVYYVGINTGTLGFKQEINPEEIDEFVRKLNNNDFKIDEMGLQETKVKTKTDTYEFYSLNEIVIRDAKFKTAFLIVKVDGELLEEFAGDGILVSTSLGSSAYNASLGGSIVGGKIHTVQITPIAPLVNRVYKSLRNSLLLPEKNVITIEPNYQRDNDLLVVVDGVDDVYEDVIHLTTKVGRKKILGLVFDNHSYITKIHEKMIK